MKTSKTVKNIARVFIGFSAFSLLSVSVMAFFNPQSVMDLVQVKLNNTDAFSSIRGVYGGVGLTLFISLIYLMVKNVKQGLGLLSLLWGFYALSRAITILVEGPLGSFGSQWIITELILFVIATILFILHTEPNYETK
jgi:hypothetical protein